MMTSSALALQGFTDVPVDDDLTGHRMDEFRVTGACRCGHKETYRVDGGGLRTLVHNVPRLVCPKCKRAGTSRILYGGDQPPDPNGPVVGG